MRFIFRVCLLGSVVTMSIDGHQENSATHQIEKRKNNNKKKLRGLKKKGEGEREKKRGKKIPAVQFDRE